MSSRDQTCYGDWGHQGAGHCQPQVSRACRHSLSGHVPHGHRCALIRIANCQDRAYIYSSEADRPLSYVGCTLVATKNSWSRSDLLLTYIPHWQPGIECALRSIGSGTHAVRMSISYSQVCRFPVQRPGNSGHQGAGHGGPQVGCACSTACQAMYLTTVGVL